MNICIIPARGGSKRIPRKNIKLFNGLPMIAYAIVAAQKAGIFDRIIVSTDDPEIASVSTGYGAEVPFVRPASIADDFAGTVPVIAHAISATISEKTEKVDVCCIYPCVPLLACTDLVQSYKKFKASQYKYLFPVARFTSPIQRSLRLSAEGVIEPFFPEYSSTRTQDVEAAFYDAGQFYWGEKLSWTSGLNIHLNAGGYEIPEWRVVDIDYPDDWLRAEAAFHSLTHLGLLT